MLYFPGMARIARIVVPGIPHHIIQRGNRRQKVFFCDEDRKTYLDYLNIYAKPAGISIWAYCLMDNHVHLIAVPNDEGSLAYGLGEAHRRYTRMINFREGWKGYLWQGRFKSYPLGDTHLYAAIRYVENNPVKAKITSKAGAYPWSSAKAHIERIYDPLLDRNFVIDETKDWAGYLSDHDHKAGVLFRKHENTGRPLGDDLFVDSLEQLTGKPLRKKKPGPKKKAGN
jgi:putative transposase